ERGGPPMGMRSPAQVRPDGSFTLTGVTPGDYILRVGVPGSQEAAVQPVTVAGGDISDVQLLAGRAATIRGRVLSDSGETPPRASVFNIGMMSAVPMMGGGDGRVNNDYTFEIRAVPGHGTIRAFVGDADWSLHAVKLNGVDITDSGIEAPADAVIDGV